MPRAGFSYKKRRTFPAWGARREWPPINPNADDPNSYVYLSSRFITRITRTARGHPPIFFVGSSESHGVQTGATSRTISGNIGSHTGDLLVTVILNAGSGGETNPITPPDATWHLIRRDVGIHAATHTQTWWKVTTALNDGGGVWTFGPAGSAELAVMVMMGFTTNTSSTIWSVDDSRATIAAASLTSAGDYPIAAPNATASQSGSHLLISAFESANGASINFPSWTLPSTLTQRYNNHTNSGVLAVGTRAASAGATGIETATLTITALKNSTDQISQSIIFKAA